MIESDRARFSVDLLQFLAMVVQNDLSHFT